MCAMTGGMEMMGGMGMMGPWVMGGPLFILIVLLGLAVAGGVWLGRLPAQRSEYSQQLEADPAQDELRRRYAAGKIDREEYLQRKIDME